MWKPDRSHEDRQYRAEMAWAYAPTHPDPDAIDLTVKVLTSGVPPRLTHSDAIWLKELVFETVKDVHGRAECYRELINELRSVFEYGDGVGGGWVNILTDAGKVSYGARQGVSSEQFLDLAWKRRTFLASGTEITAKAIAHIATLYGSSVCAIPDSDDREKLMDIALARLKEARQLVLEHASALRIELIRLGICAGMIWYERIRKGRIGWLDGAEQRWDQQRQAEIDFWGTEGLFLPDDKHPSHNDYARLDSMTKRDLGRLLSDMAGSAEILGEHEVASHYAHHALQLSQWAGHELRARLSLARLEQLDPMTQVYRYEELLRDVMNGAVVELSPRQQGDAYQRLADGALTLTKTLNNLKHQTAASFWRWHAAIWRQAASLSLPSANTTKMSLSPLRADELKSLISSKLPATGISEPVRATRKNASAGLKRALKRQHVPGLVLTLLELANQCPAPSSDLISLLASVDSWRPSKRGHLAERLPLSECHTANDVARICAEIAAEFAEGYVQYLRPEALNRLAENFSLSSARRQISARDAFREARRTGRWLEAIKAQRILLSEHHKQKNMEGVCTSVSRIRIVVRTALGMARGTADLIDIAQELTAQVREIAGELAEWNYHELAFDTAHAPVGALSHAFTEDPELIKEFELVEQWHKSGFSWDAGQPLFDAMLARIGKQLHAGSPPVDLAAGTTDHFGEKVTFIQLLNTDLHGAWALGMTVIQKRRHYWSVKLDVADTWLQELGKTLWAHLRASRGSRSASALELLYNKVVQPILSKIGAVNTIVIVPHGSFAGLPLHAALGPQGYLIENLPVSYVLNLNASAVDLKVPQSAIVGCWDREIASPQDPPQIMRELADKFQAMGLHTIRPRRAVDGRHEFLSPNSAWGILHIVAHGFFESWPASTRSRLELSPSVSIEASDWLRSGCRAAIAFVQACSVGRQEPHAGDLSGFPLALRVRGTIAEVSALSPIPAATAHDFAAAFYENLDGADSLRAYQAACIHFIRNGYQPSDWAPYLHAGPPVCLPRRKERSQQPRARKRARKGR